MKRILVIHSGALGDSILILPAIKALREQWPSSNIEVIGSPPLIQLVLGRYYADRVTSIDKAGFSNFFARSPILSKNCVDYFTSFELVVCFIKDKCLIQNIKSTGANRIVYATSENTGKSHMADYLMKILKPLGISGEGIPRIYFSGEDKLFASVFWEKHNPGSSPVAAIHPGSGSRKKNWPIERFREIARWLLSSHGAKIIVPHGEADEEITHRMSAGFSPGEITTLKDFSLPGLGAVLSKCSFFLGNDSGISHLAAAAGIPVICIFGPTNPAVWAPRGKVTILVKKLLCSPCSHEKMLSCENQICLKSVKVEDVRKAIENNLVIPALPFLSFPPLYPQG